MDGESKGTGDHVATILILRLLLSYISYISYTLIPTDNTRYNIINMASPALADERWRRQASVASSSASMSTTPSPSSTTLPKPTNGFYNNVSARRSS